MLRVATSNPSPVDAAALFRRVFRRDPLWIAQAPGRVNLIGDHTDYSGGFVLPMAIDRVTQIAAARGRERWSTVVSTAIAGVATVSLGAASGVFPHTAPAVPSFAKRLFGIAEGFRRLGYTVPELDLAIDSSLPLGGGLSSSAALEVAMATLLESILGETLAPRDKALICQSAEHEFAGVPCGIMDMLISAAAQEGTALLIDCRELTWKSVSIPAEARIVVVDTGTRHNHASGEYAIRRAECEQAAALLGVRELRDADRARLERASTPQSLGPGLLARARHVITENARTLAAAEALAAGDLERTGSLMFQSHVSLRDCFEVSCAELDCVVDTASYMRSDGVLGARMTGGGFGGCAVVLCRDDAVPRVTTRIRERFTTRFGQSPTWFVAAPSGPARMG